MGLNELMIITIRIQSCKIILRRVKRIINPFIFQNNFQFLPLHFLYFEKKCFKGFF